jgi:Ni/Co efflux regulator RcnB
VQRKEGHRKTDGRADTVDEKKKNASVHGDAAHGQKRENMQKTHKGRKKESEGERQRENVRMKEKEMTNRASVISLPRREGAATKEHWRKGGIAPSEMRKNAEQCRGGTIRMRIKHTGVK